MRTTSSGLAPPGAGLAPISLEPIVTEIFFGYGVAKLGNSVLSFSRKLGLPSEGGTCPGATTAPGGCLAPATVVRQSDGKVFQVKRACYPCRGHTAIWQAKGLYDGNMGPDVENPKKLKDALDRAMMKVKRWPGSPVLLRHGVEGDFDTVRYIRSWEQVLKWRPKTTFWAYTRSWRVLELQRALEELRSLPNVQVFASMDWATWNSGELPPGWFRLPSGEVRPVGGAWRQAWMGPAPYELRRYVFQCPETRPMAILQGKNKGKPEPRYRPSCESCQICFLKETKRAVNGPWFPAHW